MTSRIQHRRTSTPNSPPAGLLPGELSVEMADPLRLWVGVPTGIDATQRRLLMEGGPATLATIAYVDAQNATQNTTINTKADKTYVDSQNSTQDTTIATKAATTYVDSQDALKVAKAGDTMSGPLVIPGPPTVGGQAANKSYVDSQIGNVAQFPEAPQDSFSYGRRNAAWSKVLADAPSDANAYGRKAGAWVDVTEEAPSDGLGYMRKNGAWAPSTGGATTDDLPPPAPLQDGQLWWKSDTGTLYVYYDDGNTTQWVEAAAPAAPFAPANYVVKTARRSNLVINGALNISQENGNTEGTIAGWYAADQFAVDFVAASAAMGFARIVVAPNSSGSNFRLRLRVTTAKASLAAGDTFGIYTRLEGLNVNDLCWMGTSAQQKDAVLQFGFNGPAGTYAISIRNGAFNYSFVALFTITAGQAGIDTLQTIKVPAPPSGAATWATDNTASINLWITLAAGSTGLAPAAGWSSGNFVGVTGMSNGLAAVQSFQIWDLYFGADPDKTGVPPVFEVPDYASELVKCQRYFEFASGASIYGYQLAGAVIQSNYPFKVKKRVVPSMGALSWTSTNNGSGQTPALTTADGFVFQAAAAATGTMFFQGLSCNASARM